MRILRGDVFARRVRPQGAGVAFGAADGRARRRRATRRPHGHDGSRAKRRDEGLGGADQGVECLRPGGRRASGGLAPVVHGPPAHEDVVADQGDRRLATPGPSGYPTGWPSWPCSPTAPSRSGCRPCRDCSPTSACGGPSGSGIVPGSPQAHELEPGHRDRGAHHGRQDDFDRRNGKLEELPRGGKRERKGVGGEQGDAHA